MTVENKEALRQTLREITWESLVPCILEADDINETMLQNPPPPPATHRAKLHCLLKRRRLIREAYNNGSLALTEAETLFNEELDLPNPTSVTLFDTDDILVDAAKGRGVVHIPADITKNPAYRIFQRCNSAWKQIFGIHKKSQ